MACKEHTSSIAESMCQDIPRLEAVFGAIIVIHSAMPHRQKLVGEATRPKSPNMTP
jgi:hypothetical protein